MMKEKVGKFLCWLGLHDWEYMKISKWIYIWGNRHVAYKHQCQRKNCNVQDLLPKIRRRKDEN